MRLVIALSVLTLITVAAAQSTWDTHPQPALGATLYIQRHVPLTEVYRSAVWIYSPTTIGAPLLEWARQALGAFFHCEEWTFEGVEGGSIVLTATSYLVIYQPSNARDQQVLNAYRYPTSNPPTEAWANAVEKMSCGSYALSRAARTTTQTLYVPLPATTATTTAFKHANTSGTIVLSFDHTTNLLTTTLK